METLVLRRIKRERGFSLLEVIIAILILAFGLLAVAGLMSQVSTSTNSSRTSGMEVLLASERLEDLNAYGLSDCNLTPGGSLTTNAVPVTCPTDATKVVNYVDTVQISSGLDLSSKGDIVETIASKDTGGNPQYKQTIHKPSGQAGVSQWIAGAAPNPTADMLVFNRRWLIEKDAPVTGVYRITVWVALTTTSGNSTVPFQTSLVRPYL